MKDAPDLRPGPEGEVPAGPGGAEEGPSPAASGRCDLCGGPVVERHCKVQCLNCGYQRDCSDP